MKVKDKETGREKQNQLSYAVGLTRRFINKQIGRIKRMFGWAVENELLKEDVYRSLTCVKGLRKDKSGTGRNQRFNQSPMPAFRQCFREYPPIVRVMIQVQRLCGGRPRISWS